MLQYIVEDFEKARLLNDDPTIGAMVICDSAKQAKQMAEIFEAKYSRKVIPMKEPEPFVSDTGDRLAAEDNSYNQQRKQEREVNTAALEAIRAKARELNRTNALLRAKYDNDEKYARMHKRLMEKYPLSDRERKLFEALSAYKAEADDKIAKNSQLLQNEDFAERELLRLAIQQLNKAHGLDFDTASIKTINKMILKEYLDESNGKVPA
jgi:type I restriction enzyme R subunit